jgi:hypothetical protein
MEFEKENRRLNNKDNNDNILAKYGIKRDPLGGNDEDLQKNIDILQDIVDQDSCKCRHEYEIIKKMLQRFIKRLERITKVQKVDTIEITDTNIDNHNVEENKLETTNIVTFEEVGKGRGYFILIFKPKPTEEKPLPDVLVLCHTTDQTKYIFTQLQNTNIGYINKDTDYLIDKIREGQFKFAKLGNDQSIFNLEKHEILQMNINENEEYHNLKNFTKNIKYKFF